MKGMILAAGFGTRLAPLTDRLPKALVPVAGRPMIAHAVDVLRRAGCDELIVNAHHFAGQVEEYFLRHDAGVPVQVLHEREILGTGGGLLNAAPLLEKEDVFLLYNADIFVEADLAAMLRAFLLDAGKGKSGLSVPAEAAVHAGASVNAAAQTGSQLATLLVNRRETTRALLFDEQGGFLGKEAWTAEGLAVPSRAQRYGFCGVHAVSGDIFRLGFPPGFSDIFDIYRHGMQRGHTLRAFVTDAYWTDLGSAERIRQHEAR
jgi:NDP-sugar pyrophosphorylase family protein